MTATWTPPARTWRVEPENFSRFTLDLLQADAAECVQIETPQGVLIKVLRAEQDLGGQPHELQQFLDEARNKRQEWILVGPMPLDSWYACNQ